MVISQVLKYLNNLGYGFSIFVIDLLKFLFTGILGIKF